MSGLKFVIPVLSFFVLQRADAQLNIVPQQKKSRFVKKPGFFIFWEDVYLFWTSQNVFLFIKELIKDILPKSPPFPFHDWFSFQEWYFFHSL